jgi:hypothetical protein
MPSVLQTTWSRRVGMNMESTKVLIAILSGYRVFGRPVLSQEIRQFLRDIGEIPSAHGTRAIAALERRGWIRAVARVERQIAYVPTARGWQILGLENRPSRAA